jgi:hypothetical protein
LAAEEKKRDWAIGAGCERGQIGELGDELCPEVGAGGAGLLLGCRLEFLGAELDGDRRVGLEVVVPGRLLRRSAVGGGDRDGAAVQGRVGQRRDVLDP